MKGRLALLIFAGTAAMLYFTYALVFASYAVVTTLQVTYALVVIFLGALPCFIALSAKSEQGLMPLLPLHGIFYASTFGLPVLFDKTDWLRMAESDISNSLLLTIFGLLFLYLGYYATSSIFKKLKSTQTTIIPAFKLIYVGWMLFLFYLLFQFFPFFRSIPSIEQLSAPLGYMSLGILFLAFLDRQLSFLHSLCIIFAIVFALLLKTLSGSLALTVLLVVFLAVLYWNIKRRIPWHFGIAIALFTVLLNPIKMEYRGTTWADEGFQMTQYDKAILMGDIFFEYYRGANILDSVSEDETTVNRLAHIVTFGHVVSLTPSAVPFWAGESYQTLWTSFIPRFLWSEKPKATVGQDFGHRYKLISENNEFTSINLPWLIEFYANFGMFGVLGGMLFVGVFFRFIVHRLSVPVKAAHQHVLGVTVMFGLFYAESNFSLMVGGMLTTYIFFLLLLRLFSSKTPLSIIQGESLGR